MKSDIFSLGSIHECKDADGQDQLIERRRTVDWYDMDKVLHTFSFRGDDEESDRGYDTEPAPMIE